MSTLTLQPIADTYLDDYHPGTNFGPTTPLQIGNTSSDKTNAYCRALLRFDITALAGQAITSATLKLSNTGDGTTTATTQFRIRQISQPAWTENGATWNTYDGVQAWTSPGGDSTTPQINVTIPTTTADLTVDLTGPLQNVINSNKSTYELLIKHTSETNLQLDFSTFASREHSDPTKQPTLTITTPPRFIPAQMTGGFQDLSGNL